MSFQAIADPEPKTAFLLANEAIARAVLEADVKVAAFYPGSPTSEILDSTYLLAGKFGDLKMEVSVNEKVALETAAGASMAGVRAFTSMKSVGLNVASDVFYTLGYTGVCCGLVIVVADDPHAHSSQSEQDGRFFAPTGHVPMLEPSTPQEAYEMVKFAFELSERYKTMVLIRTTTRVNHQYAAVKIGSVKRASFEQRSWKDVGAKYYTLSDTARRLKGEAIEKLRKIGTEFEESAFNMLVEGEGDIGIVTNGVSYLHVLDAIDLLGIKPPVLKLGTTYPIPHGLVSSFLKNVKRVIVVEELMPYMEKEVKVIAKDTNPAVVVLGKESGHFGYVGEYNVPVVTEGLAKAFGINAPDYGRFLSRAQELKRILPNRPPTFCPGCPHRSTLWAVQQALKRIDFVINNDIGCYSMLLLEPYDLTDSLLCMGASLGVSGGMQHVLKDKIVAFVGDSTFFHAALPGLVNAVHNKHNYTLFILDNNVTAMTGQQPNPGSDFGPNPVAEIDIESVVKGIGVKNVVTINAYDPKPNVDIIKDALSKEGPSVIISKGPCALYNDRKKRSQGVPIIPNKVDDETCKTVYACVRDLYCPAIQLDMVNRHASIQDDLCDGCMVCAKLCPLSAIHSTGGV